MFGTNRIALVLSLALACAANLRAEEKKPMGSVKPAGAPLELTVSGEAKYTLDLGGKTPAEYAKSIEDAKAKGGRMPAPPKVDLKLTVKNTSDQDIQIHKGGDSVVLELELKGKGALSVAPNLAFTQEFRLPVAAELKAGKSIEFTLTALSGGFRGASKFAYWTAPGDYELVVSWKTAVNPAPKGSEANEGFGAVVVTAAPFKMTVTEKK